MTKDDFLSVCQKYAESKGGKCLSSEYILSHNKLLWGCEFGHQWEAIPSNVMRGKWCSVCSKNKKLSIDDCIILASSRGGKCLSTEYVKSNGLITWQCKYGHIWLASHNNIKTKGCWCPDCASNTGERICRAFFEKYFNKPFHKMRPEFLRKENGYKLELDGFNEELKIAFEYQGIQHYNIDGFYIKNQEQLKKRMKDDWFKIKSCHKNNINLILIDQFNNISDINSIIKDLNLKLKIIFNLSNEVDSLDLNKIYLNRIDEYKDLAKTFGGECLSAAYEGYYNKLLWKCYKGHVWYSVGYSVENGHWCPDCSKNRKGHKYII